MNEKKFERSLSFIFISLLSLTFLVSAFYAGFTFGRKTSPFPEHLVNPKPSTQPEENTTSQPVSSLTPEAKIAFSKDGDIWISDEQKEWKRITGDATEEEKEKISNVSPKWSPDGNYLAFKKNYRAIKVYTMQIVRVEIYVVDSDGANLKKLFETEETEYVSYTWSPNSQNIGIVLHHMKYYEKDGRSVADAQIKAIQVKDGAIKDIGTFQEQSGCGGAGICHYDWLKASVFAWSAYDTFLYDTTCDNEKVKLMTKEGEEKEIVDNLRNVYLSPDRKRLVGIIMGVLRAKTEEEKSKLVVANADGTNLQEVKTTKEPNMPVWSKDGQLIYFSTSRQTGSFKLDIEQSSVNFSVYSSSIWQIRPDGSEEKKIFERNAEWVFAKNGINDNKAIYFRQIENNAEMSGILKFTSKEWEEKYKQASTVSSFNLYENGVFQSEPSYLEGTSDSWYFR